MLNSVLFYHILLAYVFLLLVELVLTKDDYEYHKESRSCTVPAIFGLREWYESRFGELCYIHDQCYSRENKGYELNRLKCDLALTLGMIKKGYIAFAILTQLFVTLIGWWWWYKVLQKIK